MKSRHRGNDFIGTLFGVGGTAEHEFRFDGVQLELEAHHHAEIATATAQRPEEIGVFGFTGVDQPAIGGYDVGGHQIVDAEAMGTAQPADAAGERQARNAGRRYEAARRGATEWGGRRIDISPGGATFDDGAIKTGTTRTPFMSDMSIINPPSQTA